jgi:hypothetical protein
MHTSTQTAPAVNAYPPVVRHLDFGLVVIDITTAKGKSPRKDSYFLERIEGIDDLAYSLAKVNPAFHGTDPENEVYAVNLTTSTCDCKGWHRWCACKHLSNVRQAYEEGGLP